MKTLLVLISLITLPLFAGDIVVYPLATATIANGASITGCTGGYVGFLKYKKPVPNFGWAPDTNNFTVFTISDTNKASTKIQYNGHFGDVGCNPTTVTLPTHPPSDKYAFVVYFTNLTDIPATTNYPIVMHDFLP